MPRGYRIELCYLHPDLILRQRMQSAGTRSTTSPLRIIASNKAPAVLLTCTLRPIESIFLHSFAATG